ncbi:MAG: hypothetical protein AAF927_15965 [Bacteroidota bacterium]
MSYFGGAQHDNGEFSGLANNLSIVFPSPDYCTGARDLYDSSPLRGTLIRLHPFSHNEAAGENREILPKTKSAARYNQ